MGVFQFGDGFANLERAYSHGLILPESIFIFKPRNNSGGLFGAGYA
jgi:hypothetical protein